MNINKLLFVSFNNSCINVYNPNTKTINNTNLTNLKNIAVENNIVVCNKFLLNRHIKSNTLDTKIKDILYLYAILFPTKFTNNTIVSLAKVLNINIPKSLEEQAYCLYNIYDNLIKYLNSFSAEKKNNILTINNFISKNIYWDWNKEISFYLANSKEIDFKGFEQISKVNLLSNNINLNNNNYLTDELTLNILDKYVKRFGSYRKFQKEYALAVSKVFTKNDTIVSIHTDDSNKNIFNSSFNSKYQNNSGDEVKTNIVFAEAATGIGKTLGYLSAAIAFINHNPENRIVISTYSKALQTQVLNELKSLLDKDFFNNKVSLIKGNHNYICLLNLENLFSYINSYKSGHVFLGFILRWLQETENGDIQGGDFLPWLNNIIPYEIINNIVNKREECIYSRCKHYKKCFITKVKEKTKQSNIIISNHNLTLVNNFNSDYFIFDEAHNLYNVCDEVYKKEVSAQKGLYLRKWLTGNSSTSKNHNMPLNGIKNRLKFILLLLDKNQVYDNDISIRDGILSKTDISYNNKVEESRTTLKDNIDLKSVTFINSDNSKQIIQDTIYKDNEKSYIKDENISLSKEQIINFKINRLVDILVNTAKFLPNEDFLDNIKNNNPKNVFEEFLYYLYNHVLLHNSDLDNYYTIESHIINLSDELKDSANKLCYKLETLLKVANNLKEAFDDKIACIKNKEEKDILLEFINSYEYNCLNIIKEFIDLLHELFHLNENFIYRFVILREESNIVNIGYFKNLINPLEGFSNNLVLGKKGIVLTSATLFDSINNKDRILLNKFALNKNKVNLVTSVSLNSPFDYVKNSKIIILKQNYSKNSALRNEALVQLFLAAQGGVLTVFTSIQRLREHYYLLKNNLLLQENDINIFSQYTELNKFSSVVNLFKEDENSCLLGSDGFRDGIDIPGKSLRMVVFEKVPWPKPDILYTKRKNIYGKELEEEIVKLKLKQAFGRILRREDDKGIFIILEPGLPSKFLNAFPENIEIQKLNLEEVITVSREFFKSYIKSNIN